MAFSSIHATAREQQLSLPGDEIISDASAVIDSAFTLPKPPSEVFPWFLQLGKKRAGWYFPRPIEHFVFKSERGLRLIDPVWQQLKVGDRIPDYGGKKGYFDCFYLEKNEVIGYTSERGKIKMTWVLTFWPVKEGTRVIIRLRIKAPNMFILGSFGKLIDRFTIWGLYQGLKERL